MKVNTRESHPTYNTATMTARTSSERLTDKARASKEHQEFIRAMNEFVAKHGSITDDEFFRVI
ncbi:hypothetical protein [Silvania confinis]|uniref:hypothetical protein n=1 Tax=Silvania confinis TaxID=2926470 RepID=UPI0022FD3CA6|nr:hypothetical protein [Silvania confinis]